MGFSGIRAVILIVLAVVLFYGIKNWGFPTWSVAVGLVVGAMLLKGAEKKSEGQ